MAKIEDIEKRLRTIEERNEKVHLDKAWETSFARRLLLTTCTYLAIAIYLQIISIPKAWLHAIVPAIAFMLSTLTLPYFKEKWIGKKN